VDLAPKQNELVNRTRNAGSLLPGLMSKLRIENRRSDAEVVKVWNELLDPNLVAHAQPSGLHKGTLFVTVDNSVWLSEIVRYRRKEILTRLQHSFGRELIQKISFRIG
jgi:predicted nucleic acid-binding Zn ribbon protein